MIFAAGIFLAISLSSEAEKVGNSILMLTLKTSFSGLKNERFNFII